MGKTLHHQETVTVGPRARPRARLLALGLAAILAIPAGAQVGAGNGNIPPSAETSSIYRRDTGIDPSGRYQQEVEACKSGRTQQDRDTCLQEARNAHAARQRGELTRPGENYTANALERCQPLSGEYHAACQARVMGFGSTSGNVAGGGLLRQVETVVFPPGADQIRIQPQTPNPVVLVPTPAK